MEQRASLVTLAVADLAAARSPQMRGCPSPARAFAG